MADGQHVNNLRRLAVVGVPWNSAGGAAGEARAPGALRAAGLLDALARSVDVVDAGDAPFAVPTTERDRASGIIDPRALTQMVLATRDAVTRALARGRFPLVVGGECPLLLGCLVAARAARGRVGLLFVDGHEDAWSPARSTTGESADMELGFALGTTRPDGADDLASLLPLVAADDVVVLGPRDRTEVEAAGVPSLATSLTFLDDVDLLRRGPGTATAALAARLRAIAGGWWFHLDLDVLATGELPAVRYPQPGGLSWEALDQVTAAALRTPGLVGWNVTIYNPDLDPSRRSAGRIVEFVASALAHLSRADQEG